MKKNKGNIKIVQRFSLFIVFVLIFGCAGQSKDEAVQTLSLEGDDIVLATVNGSPVTRYEFEMTVNSTIGKKNADKLGDEGKLKVLESLVSSRAISQMCAKQLSPEELSAIDKRVQAYREEVLVKTYIKKTVKPEPVTQEMVKNYYLDHPEKFGADSIRAYEMISTEKELQMKERNSLLTVLTNPGLKENWGEWTMKLRAEGYPVFYKKGISTDKLLHPEIEKLVNSTQEGEVSRLGFVKGRFYVVRVLKVSELPPKPLTEVSPEIRKSLVPVQLKKAVKQVSEQALKNANIDYADKG